MACRPIDMPTPLCTPGGVGNPPAPLLGWRRVFVCVCVGGGGCVGGGEGEPDVQAIMRHLTNLQYLVSSNCHVYLIIGITSKITTTKKEEKVEHWFGHRCPLS